MNPKSIDDFFEAADGYADVPEGKDVYVVRGEKAFEELRAKLRPFAPQAPLRQNVLAMVDFCWPSNVVIRLDEEMKRAAYRHGGNLFYVPDGDECLEMISGYAVGDVYLIHITEGNNPFRP